ncbi:MAG: sel1 repeat family protein [Desulfobulbaceae bacterium]|nr:sel1 repeat family protein [Desulfobulbaceae bacterium]
MKNKILMVGALAILLLVGKPGSICFATSFDDPNVSAMHNTVNALPGKAENGDPQAQTSMGMISLFGFGGSQDYATAKKWFQMAADQGYPEAMVQLGNLYENGFGVENDPVKAMNFYKQASELNYPQGRFRLGLLYFGGIGVSKNEVEGAKLLHSACDNGYRTSCGMLQWQDNKISEARSEFTLQCQAGDQLACSFLAQLGPGEGGTEGAKAEQGQQQGGRIWIYLAIGLVLVGLLVFWLIRNDSAVEEGKKVE